MKGVSAVIATILMLIITIGLAGTAYVYISGMLTTKMEKTISVLDASCNGTHITMVVANDGTDSIAPAELTIYVNNMVSGATLGGALSARSTAVITDLVPTEIPGSNTVLIVSPSNSVRQSVWCTA